MKSDTKKSNLSRVAGLFDREHFQTVNEEMSFSEYLDRCYENPRLCRTAYQTIYDMIMSKGTEKIEKFRKTYIKYNFFTCDDEIQVFGLYRPLHDLVQFFRGAAGGYGPECRVLLLHGPVGSSKSTICRLLKRQMEKYSQADEGKWYTFKWVDLPTGPDGIYTSKEDESAMHEQPLKLLPEEARRKVMDDLNNILREKTPENERDALYTLTCEGALDPRSRKFMTELLKRYNGDLEAVLDKHIRVVRRVYSECDRMGIATFQPKDEKNQDSTELTGDINWSKLQTFGTDSDPRAFGYDGEFCVGNRGIIEFIEALKLAKEFLYDLLGASQEKQIKPKKAPQINVDLAIIAHTNLPDFEKLKNDKHMEALRDRTTKIDIPYLLEWRYELAVLEQRYGNGRVRQHIAPHTLEIAALWAVLTRLEDEKDGRITLVEKAKLYDERVLPGWTIDAVKELKDKYPNEGLDGVSCRYVQDKISACLSNNFEYINFFMVLSELKEGLDHSSLLNDQEKLEKYRVCIDLVKKELDEILKNEVQKALVGDEDAIVRLCANYIDHVMAYTKKVKIKNPITGADEPPSEKLMRSIEKKIDVSDEAIDDFRMEIASFIGHLAHEKKEFDWKANPRLARAFQKKLYEDVKDHIKLSALNMNAASTVDKDMQQKIDAIKHRLITQYGYNDKSATDVLSYVASIFSRGDTTED